MQVTTMDDNTETNDITKTIVINVGGVRHEVLQKTLQTIPRSRLGRITEYGAHYRVKQGEYYFDRHSGIFAAILNLYRTGALHVPGDVCGPAFKQELDFWQLEEAQIQECCWIRYNEDKGTRDTLEILAGQERNEIEQFRITESSECCTVSTWEQNRRKVWLSLERPLSSNAAKVCAVIFI